MSVKKCIKCNKYKSISDYHFKQKSIEYYENNKGKRKQDFKLYNKTENGVLSRRNTMKRRRKLGWEILFLNPFPEEIEIEYHHINDMLVIPIPKIMHRNSLGEHHREKCNDIIKKLYDINVEIFDKNENRTITKSP